MESFVKLHQFHQNGFLTVSEKKLCDFLVSSESKSVDDLTFYLNNKFHLDKKQSEVVKHQLNNNFINYFKKKWKKSGYKKSFFDEKILIYLGWTQNSL